MARRASIKIAIFPGGGHARAGGGCYHLSFRSGSRSRGSCARAAHDYITRRDEYDNPDRDDAVYTESGHMPSWAEDDARIYWDGADLYERANGRLYVGADFALPVDLDADDQSALASAFAQLCSAVGYVQSGQLGSTSADPSEARPPGHQRR